MFADAVCELCSWQFPYCYPRTYVCARCAQEEHRAAVEAALYPVCTATRTNAMHLLQAAPPLSFFA